MKHAIRLIILLISIALLSACASLRSPNIDETPAIKAQSDIPEEELLDIGIVIFNPGIPENGKEAEEKGIYGEASSDEVKELTEEGIEIYPLPVLPEDQN